MSNHIKDNDGLSLAQRYKRDGYVVVPNFSGEKEQPMLFHAFNTIYHQDIDLYKSSLSLYARLPQIQSMFFSQQMLDILKEIGLHTPVPPTYPVMNVMGLPIPDGYNGTEAHQDWPSIQGSLDMVVAWIPFMDIGKDNYALQVIPGSHKLGLLEGMVSDGNVMEVEAHDSHFIDIECKTGDIVIFSGFLVHRTGQGTGFRMAVSMRFDNAAEPNFIKRKYPCAQKRVVDREIKWKPTIEQVQGIFK